MGCEAACCQLRGGRDRGFDDKQREAVNIAVGRSYREGIARFAGMRNLDLWYSRINVDEVLERVRRVGTAEQVKRAEKNIAKARAKGSLRAFEKLTEVVDGDVRIVSDPPAITTIEELVDAENADRIDEIFRGIIRSYRRTLAGDRRRILERFRYVHAARKVVGVGSVGTRAWIMLMLGRDGEDPLFLQFKEAEASVLEPFLGKSDFVNHGQRVVEGQRLVQPASDVMLGWIRTDQSPDGLERDFYVRQLWDAKGSALIEFMDPTALGFYATVCGLELARAHARSGDAVAISSYLGTKDTFDRALSEFAESYADQNERDYKTLTRAVRDGLIKAEPEV